MQARYTLFSIDFHVQPGLLGCLNVVEKSSDPRCTGLLS